MRYIDGIDLPASVMYLLETLEKAGYEAYIVGGCVRDRILKIEPHDWDICTSATTEQVMGIFKYDTVLPTGLKHGTVSIVINKISYEITTFRKDGKYSDCRRPDHVDFTTDLLEDLARRDFTINAMAYGLNKGLIDPYNGEKDLLRLRVIRCVGNPDDRFSEDALRILRAIRFAIQLELNIDCDTLKSAIAHRKLINHISVERIQSELTKMFSYKVESLYHQFLFAEKILFEAIPEMVPMYGFNQNNPYHIYDVWNHTLQSLVAASDDIIVRFAVLFHDIGKPICYWEDKAGCGHFYGHGEVSAEITHKAMRRLRFDNNTIQKVVELVKFHDATFVASKKNIRRWLNHIGEEQFRRLLQVRKADIAGHNPKFYQENMNKIDRIEVLLDEIVIESECFSLQDLEINGNDLIGIGYEPGVELGSCLRYLLELVIEGKVDNNKIILLKLAEELLRNKIAGIEDGL